MCIHFTFFCWKFSLWNKKGTICGSYIIAIFHDWEDFVWTFLFSGADSFSQVVACIIRAHCSVLTELHLISGPGLALSVLYEVEQIWTDHILITNTKQRGQLRYRKYMRQHCCICSSNSSSISVYKSYLLFFTFSDKTWSDLCNVFYVRNQWWNDMMTYYCYYPEHYYDVFLLYSWQFANNYFYVFIKDLILFMH